MNSCLQSATRLRSLSGILFFILVISLLTSSCSSFDDALGFSIDPHHVNFKSPDQPRYSPGGTDFAFNVLFLFYVPLRSTTVGSVMEFQDHTDLWATNTLTSKDIPEIYLSTHQTNSVTHSFSGEDIMDRMYILSGAELVGKHSGEKNNKINQNYFEIPVFAVYRHELEKGEVFGGLGPYLAYGLWGKRTFPGVAEKINTFDKELGFKRFDAGLGLIAGYQFENGIRLSLGYDLGLANLDRRPDFKAYNRTANITVSYPLEKIRELLRK